MPFNLVEEILFNPDPAAYLQHCYPFLLLDRIIELEQGVRATARTNITANAGFSQILLIECVAQLAGIIVAKSEGDGGFLAAIERADFFATPVPGDILTISAGVVKSFGRLFMLEGNVANEAGRLLSVQLTLGIGQL